MNIHYSSQSWKDGDSAIRIPNQTAHPLDLQRLWSIERLDLFTSSKISAINRKESQLF
jgi:hypothetical protein